MKEKDELPHWEMEGLQVQLRETQLPGFQSVVGEILPQHQGSRTLVPATCWSSLAAVGWGSPQNFPGAVSNTPSWGRRGA